MSSDSFTVLITGANRGIGLGLTKHFLNVKEVTKLFAAVRKPDEAKELKALSDARLKIIQLEATDDSSIQRAFKEVDAAVGSAGLNLLINNAGILIDTPFDQVNRAAYTRTFDVNSISPLVIAQTFLPLLRRASSFHASRPLGARRAAVINISSLLGSIGLNTIGSTVPSGQQTLAYRASKAALNAIVKSLSIDLKNDGILLIAQCPGWVQTDMGGPKGLLTLDQSTSQLVKNFLKYGEADNGLFFNDEGNRYDF